MSDTFWLWSARAGGAAAGSAISLAYLLPHSRREAAVRLGIGVASGLVFGGTVGLKIAAELGIAEKLGPYELVLMGSAAASLCAWWTLGLLVRFFRAKGAISKETGDE
ncbi:DUF6107 family protein [Aquamicrobium zhengzhouense]|uniref:Transmembrane protein n=1 Tax=Aquamicrobium zhengzhouense TaxID=2781738 RepID=A0ABS0SBS4_9HYPH|nr:DUF6107 family protein [Aquamicrobium zhengzhouense]MBI1620759.1 hypothetical protein [Aquamicrobium zhengzhouense]